MLKIIIFILLVLVVISLFSGLRFLFKDADNPESKRTWYALGARITFATLLMITLFYGFYTGELRIGTNAPWHKDIHPEMAQPAPSNDPPSEMPAAPQGD